MSFTNKVEWQLYPRGGAEWRFYIRVGWHLVGKCRTSAMSHVLVEGIQISIAFTKGVENVDPRWLMNSRLVIAGSGGDSNSIINEGREDEDQLYGNWSSAWRTWRQFRVRAILMCEATLRRRLELYEREVFFFPQACRVCFQAKADGMIPCEKCWNVAYCSEQHR